MSRSTKLTLFLFLLLNSPLNIQVPRLIIKNIKVFTFITNSTSNLTKLPLLSYSLLFTKYIIL
jgi:hypothetical protein